MVSNGYLMHRDHSSGDSKMMMIDEEEQTRENEQS